MFCFTAVMIKLASLSQGEGLQRAATVQSSYAVTVGESRGMIYDRNLKPLVGRSSINRIAIAPTIEAAATLQQSLPHDEFVSLVPLLESGKPIVATTSRAVYGSGIESFKFPVRYGKGSLAPHVLGYLDGSGAGVAGVESGYDDYLEERGGSVRVRYDINAIGMPLGDAATEVLDSRREEQGGVVLTLDRRMQAAAEDAASVMERGAVVVMEISSGDIVAMVSVPDFDPDNVAASLGANDSPLFNRATAAYSVGSTFKLVLGATALDAGYSTDYSYICPGYYQLGEQRYYCHNREGHWQLSMERAVGQSCNPYFVSLGQQLGARRLLETASAMGFGSSVKLAEGIVSASGSLPQYPEEVSSGELANLSFGQGTLTATPVQITRMTAIIAGGGLDIQPKLYRGSTTDGLTVIGQPEAPPQRIIKQSTAETLRELMVFVVENGSGKKAEPSYGSAGGKTGSAQTGSYLDGQEIVHGWFTGFYPGEQPKYAITVLEDGGGNGGAAPAEIFARICDQIALIENYNLRLITK